MRLELFERYVRRGEFTLVEFDGTRHKFGSGSPKATWLMRKADTLPRVLTHPALELGETYMDEGWDVADGSLSDLITILRGNMSDLAQRRTVFSEFAALIQTWNALTASSKNVHHHYDLDEELFRAFLDRGMHYSCAYFRDPDVSLESAQLAKCNHIAHKLLLSPGQQVLDIGCGWGSLALHLAETVGDSVVGLTLSAEQLRVARSEAVRRGLTDRVEFRLQDYREHRGQYDRIVSVGMFEHVGRRNFRRYFEQLARQLRPGGVALLHTIGSTRPPNSTNRLVSPTHLSGGPHSIVIDDFRGNRTLGPDGGRSRTTTATLRVDAEGMESALSDPARSLRGQQGRALLPDVGVLPRHVADCVRTWRSRRLPTATRWARRAISGNSRLSLSRGRGTPRLASRQHRVSRPRTGRRPLGSRRHLGKRVPVSSRRTDQAQLRFEHQPRRNRFDVVRHRSP